MRLKTPTYINTKKKRRGALNVMVIAVGNGIGDPISNPGRDRLHFTSHKVP